MLCQICRSEGNKATLKGWPKWAVDHNLSEDIVDMAVSFKSRCVYSFDRASIKGVKFAVKRLEDLKKSKDSIVMIADDSAPTSRQWGRVNRFLQTSYPGSRKELLIVQGSWYKCASRQESMNTAINCPVIRRDFEGVDKGQFWPLAAVIPVSVCLVPYINPRNGVINNRLWQVLAVHPDFAKDA